MPDGTKPLPKPILTYHKWASLLFPQDQFHGKCSRYQFMKWVWKMYSEFNSTPPRDQWVKSQICYCLHIMLGHSWDTAKSPCLWPIALAPNGHQVISNHHADCMNVIKQNRSWSHQWLKTPWGLCGTIMMGKSGDEFDDKLIFGYHNTYMHFFLRGKIWSFYPTCGTGITMHHSVIIGAMASQITSLTIV